MRAAMITLIGLTGALPARASWLAIRRPKPTPPVAVEATDPRVAIDFERAVRWFATFDAALEEAWAEDADWKKQLMVLHCASAFSIVPRQTTVGAPRVRSASQWFESTLGLNDYARSQARWEKDMAVSNSSYRSTIVARLIHNAMKMLRVCIGDERHADVAVHSGTQHHGRVQLGSAIGGKLKAAGCRALTGLEDPRVSREVFEFLVAHYFTLIDIHDHRVLGLTTILPRERRRIDDRRDELMRGFDSMLIERATRLAGGVHHSPSPESSGAMLQAPHAGPPRDLHAAVARLNDILDAPATHPVVEPDWRSWTRTSQFDPDGWFQRVRQLVAERRTSAVDVLVALNDSYDRIEALRTWRESQLGDRTVELARFDGVLRATREAIAARARVERATLDILYTVDLTIADHLQKRLTGTAPDFAPALVDGLKRLADAGPPAPKAPVRPAIGDGSETEF